MAGEVATPPAMVVTETVFVGPGKVRLAPLAGAVKLTLAPTTGLPAISVTVATNGLVNGVRICALCPPLVTTMVFGGPTVLVSEKLVERLLMVAVTE
jgi:hypothetical protein